MGRWPCTNEHEAGRKGIELDFVRAAQEGVEAGRDGWVPKIRNSKFKIQTQLLQISNFSRWAVLERNSGLKLG